ncbi:MAG TPA: TonB-dependent receptor [Rhizomicrobium sp.]|nr:TonB-dependent receptor [Rhizomicrobium sp.]
MIKFHNTLLAGAASAALFASGANATDFNIQSGDLGSALNAYMAQSGVVLIVSGDAVKGIKTRGVKGDLAPDAALSRLLSGTGFLAQPNSGVIAIVREGRSSEATSVQLQPMQLAQATPPRASVETVTVTSSKLGGGDVQSIPIAITAMSQEQLTATQTAGGPDLVKQVPNLTFTKTNFTGYSIQIRGIGTQAISVTTDPAVAVALNDIPFIRNHFFEQEFYDLSQAEVLRGPQGTLYGRNATAGVVNLTTAKPTDQFEAMASGDIGNYKNRRFEGMVNLPILDDRLDIRLAGEWTKRDGYTTNLLTGDQVDGRDLWSSRLSIGWKPFENLKATLVWEHFSEDDDRMRTSKQLCKTDPGPSTVAGVHVPRPGEPGVPTDGVGLAFYVTNAQLSQGCLPSSLYNPDAFEVPNGYSLPYVIAGYVSGGLRTGVDPYASTTQSTDLREIETQINPIYRAKNDTIELNADYNVTPAITLTSQTGYNQDFLWSTEDYNRFNTTPGGFQQIPGTPYSMSLISADGVFCDPQLGCSNRLVAQDVSRERAWQLSQEIRLTSNLAGPLNFSLGGNYMHYETVEDYYVFANTLTLFAATAKGGSGGSGGSLLDYGYGQHLWVPGVSDNHECLRANGAGDGYQYSNPAYGAGVPTEVCYALDPSSLRNADDSGHNYFLSRNPYTLNSYAGFGEVYYNVFNDLKLTGGLRWTDDQKHFTLIPSELLVSGYGYPSIGVVDQDWQKFTGRFAANWTPKLDFTDQTLVYGSYARGYKAGGANPPGAVLFSYGAGVTGIPVHPLTFAPEYINAFEVGSKNTLLDGALTLNGNIFFYDYHGYQISEIVDRTSINLNFDATVKGAELEATYEPMPGLKFHFAGGYEHTRLADGSNSVDLMDRTAGHPGWVIYRPFVTQSSNCIFPDYVAAALIQTSPQGAQGNYAVSACGDYATGTDPVVQGVYHSAWTGADDPAFDLVNGQPYYSVKGCSVCTEVFHGYTGTVSGAGNTIAYNGFDPATAPNGGAGFSKDLSGNELPNAPPFTVSFSADYTIPVTADWAATLHGDYYWQDYSWARVFNDNPYDRLRGYTNVNLALILTSQNGWQFMGYLKNVFNVTDITGTFLNSDDSGLTTNIFVTDPRLFGVRVTKNW